MTFAKRIAALAAVLLVPLSLAGCGYNALPTQKNAAQTQWANVQADYQRRSDLIPALVNTVKGYAAQEKSVLVEVTQARASVGQIHVDANTLNDPAKFQQFQQAQGSLGDSLNRLMVVSERYPDLKSNQNFLALQNSLEMTENRITYAIRDYNAAANTYNTSLVTFPTLIWHNTFQSSYKPLPLFQASATAQNMPTVDFSAPSATPTAPAPAPAAK
ncbi:MAG TPA: LemA family protein [Caulobacteraceae bacterium]|jgi:LemA protein|nr:LemA family protein [Caulobacteraceae bacterium]